VPLSAGPGGKFKVDVAGRAPCSDSPLSPVHRHPLLASLHAACARLSPARVYLTLALVFGIAVLFANPPFQAPDEYMHYFRIHQLCLGDIKPVHWGKHTGGNVPAAVSSIAWPGEAPGYPERKLGWTFLESKLRPWFVDWSQAPIRQEHFPHTSVYSPTAYWAQIPAVALGKLLHLGPLLLLYLARLASLLVTITLSWLAVRALPRHQWAATLLLLSPTVLYFAGSCAPDGLLIASAALIVARLARAQAVPTEPARPLEITGLLLLGGAISTTKFVYFPIVALIPLILWPTLPAARARWVLLMAWVIICLLPTAFWAHFMSSQFTPGREDIPIDPHAQVQHILAHPLDTVALVVRSYWEGAATLAPSIVGVLGWNDTPMPGWFYSCFGAAIVLMLVLDGGSHVNPSPLTAACFFGAAVASLALVAVALYAQWNPPGSTSTIDGLVGRYLVPTLPAILLAIPRPHRLQIPGPWAHGVGAAVAFVSAATCFVAVVARYYEL
jgi:hypothetical protein